MRATDGLEKSYQFLQRSIENQNKLFNDFRCGIENRGPLCIRPMEAKDVEVGVWYWDIIEDLNDDPVYFLRRIEEVLKPNDKFKGFVADDGCRYGLDCSFVEIEVGHD